MKPIAAIFTVEKGRWSEADKSYVSRTTETRVKDIFMTIDKRPEHDSGDVLRFVGGPTGFECYPINAILLDDDIKRKTGSFCICAGTINSWAKCEVPWADVLAFLSEEGYEKNNNPTQENPCR